MKDIRQKFEEAKFKHNSNNINIITNFKKLENTDPNNINNKSGEL